jgi:hypothetical protein
VGLTISACCASRRGLSPTHLSSSWALRIIGEQRLSQGSEPSVPQAKARIDPASGVRTELARRERQDGDSRRRRHRDRRDHGGCRESGESAVVGHDRRGGADGRERLRRVVCRGWPTMCSSSTPEPYVAVGAWYDHFPQVTDEEIVDLLATARTPGVHATGSPARARRFLRTGRRAYRTRNEALLCP